MFFRIFLFGVRGMQLSFGSGVIARAASSPAREGRERPAVSTRSVGIRGALSCATGEIYGPRLCRLGAAHRVAGRRACAEEGEEAA